MALRTKSHWIAASAADIAGGMEQTLLIGDYAYSSWSLRGWLLFDRFDLPVTTRMIPFHARDVADQLAAHAPARTVPTWITPEGIAVSDSLAIAEELATRHPDAGLWPADPGLRALARTLAAEMHSGFATLRGDCPMNLRVAYAETPVSDALRADLDRLETIWSHALDRSGGPWLCGDYSVADVFYAPVAARIAGYALPVSDRARAYVDAHLADPSFRRWRAMGLVHGEDLPWYARDYPVTDWPGPAPRTARPSDSVAQAVNATCPYSGRPVMHALEMEGTIYGFCNAFCRDKTAADPMAWPAFAALVDAR